MARSEPVDAWAQLLEIYFEQLKLAPSSSQKQPSHNKKESFPAKNILQVWLMEEGDLVKITNT